MLVMSETDKVYTHILHQLHFRTHHIFSHCLSYSGMIFMAVRSLKQKTPAIQEERAFFLKFELAETEAFFRCQCLSVSIYSQFASIKVGRIHVPQDGVLHFYFCQELIAKRQNIFYRLSKYPFAICIIYRDSHIRLPYIHRIIERGFDFYRTFFPVCRKFRFQANLFKRGFR